MFEKIDKERSRKLEELNNDVDYNRGQIQIKKHNLVQEEYTRTTLLALQDRMSSDLIRITKEVQYYKEIKTRVVKKFAKMKIDETGIKERVNQLYNREMLQEKVLEDIKLRKMNTKKVKIN